MTKKTRTGAIPPVPANTPVELRPFLENVRENLEVQLGRRGKKLDKAVTFRDLGGIDLSALSRITGSGGSGSIPGGTDPGGGPVETPTAPTSFQASAGFDFVLLQWDIPTYIGHGITEIYRISVDPDAQTAQTFTVANAVLVGSTATFLYSDTVAVNSTHYYWARHVNTDGDPGPWHSTDGLVASTSATYDELLQESLAEILAGLSIWQNDYTTALGILDNAVLSALLDSAETSDTIAAAVSAAEERLNSSINTNFTAVADETAAATLKLEQLQSTIFNVNPDGSFVLDANNQPVMSGAFIDNLDSTLAGVNGELMAAVGTTLRLQDASNNNYSLTDIMQIALDADGNYTAQWGVKLTKGELLYGVGLVQNPITDAVTFTVSADSFAVFNPADEAEIAPFIVNAQGQVLINTAFIDTAAITSLIAGNIVASQIAAGVSITSPRIVGAEIIGGTLNINNKMTVTASGLLRAEDAFIQGHIEGDSGRLNNVIIEDTCEVRGTVNAKNIEGDIIDRSVLIVNNDVDVGANSNYTIMQGTVLPGFIGGEYNRVLTITGISLDHNNGGGGISSFDVVLYLDNIEVQRFRSSNVEEEGSVTPTLGCLIPLGATSKVFKVTLETGTDDSIRIQRSAIVADVCKKGGTIDNVSGLFGTGGPSGSAYIIQ